MYHCTVSDCMPSESVDITGYSAAAAADALVSLSLPYLGQDALMAKKLK